MKTFEEMGSMTLEAFHRYVDEVVRKRAIDGRVSEPRIRYAINGVDYTKELASPEPPLPDQPRSTASEVRARTDQMESVSEQMRRYRAEDMWRELMMAHPLYFPAPPRVDDAVFKWESRRPKKELTFTALQDTVLPDLYGRKQHAQLLAAQREREAAAAARLREETNNKIGGLLRGFLGARREEEDGV